MKKILIIFSFLYSVFNLFSQDKFNRIYGFLSDPALFNIEVVDNGYVAVGAYTDFYVKACIIKYNLSGDTTQTIIYEHDTMSFYVGAQNSLQATGTGNYILAGQYAVNWYRDNMLIKFDNNFDTIFTKIYYPVDDNGYKDVINYNTCVGQDTSYLMVGYTNIDNNYDSLYQYQMQLIKTDTLGNLLWRKTYGNNTYRHYAYKVVNTFEGGYLLGGWSNKNGGDWALVKTDENGENPIYRYFGSSVYDDGRIMGITPTKDSCYIVTGGKGVDFISFDKIFKGWILKLDKNLNVVWEKFYLNKGETSFFYNVLEKEDGSLYAHGTHDNNLFYDMAVIMELTSEGDSVWRQETTSNNMETSTNSLESAKITTDGSLILAGFTFDISFTPYQQMWLVKTDSMGCDGTEWTCDINYLEEVASKEGSGLRVYPNPTKSTLFVELKGESKKVKVSSTANIPVIAACPDLSGSTAKQSVSDKEIVTSKALGMTLSIEQFQELPINQKLKYNIAHPKQNLWTEKEEQEMRELSCKFAYAFPFEVIKGKVDIFAIEPALAMRVENKKLKVNTAVNNSEFPLKKWAREINNSEQEITIYDINGRIVKKETLDVRPHSLEINVSSLQKGIYFVQVGGNVAKFVKE